MKIAVPFSLRQPFKKISDVKMCNDFGSLLIRLPLYRDFEDALKPI